MSVDLNQYIGFAPHNIDLNIGKVVPSSNSFSKIMAQAITWLRSIFGGGGQEKSLNRHLWRVYKAESALNEINATRIPSHMAITTARKTFLKVAWELNLDAKTTTVTQKIPFETAYTLLQCVEWGGTDKDNPKNIQRLLPKVKDDSAARQLTNQFGELFGSLHEKFYSFRQELVSHQSSMVRTWRGIKNDPCLVKAHSDLIAVWECFLTDKKCLLDAAE